MTLTQSFKYGFVTIAVLAIAYLAGFHTMIAKAAVLVFSPTNCYTAAATSTLQYMTPGTATTTVSCDMGYDGASAAVLAIQVNASSTAAIFNIYVEESMDGQDWYPVGQGASTTNPYGLGTRAYSTFSFASSTIGGAVAPANGVGVSGTQNRNHYELDVPVRMKRVRAYAGITGANAGMWMQILPKVSL